MEITRGVLLLGVIVGSMSCVFGVQSGVIETENVLPNSKSEHHPPPPLPPKCNFDDLMDVNKELLKGIISKSVDDYVGDRTDIDALKIKNVLCITDTDKIKLVTSATNFISSCLGLPNLSPAQKEILENVEKLIDGSQKACVVWNAMRYETVGDKELFSRAEVVFMRLCEAMCEI